MTLYLVIYILFFALAIIQFVSKSNGVIIAKHTRWLSLSFSALIIGIFSGARQDIGGFDYGMYEYFFGMAPESPGQYLSGDVEPFLTISCEPGYIYIMTVFKSLGLDFNAFFLFLGVACSFLLLIAFLKYEKYLYLSIVIFLGKGYLYYFFTAQRQIIAMVICFLAIGFIVRRKFFFFLIMVIIASFFHTSAIIFLPAYWLYKLNLNKKATIICFILAGLAGLLHLGRYTGTAIASLLPFGSEKLNMYLEGETGVNMLNFVELVPLTVVLLVYKEKLSERIPNFQLLFNFYIVFFVLTISFADFSIVSRLKGYYLLGYIGVLAGLVDIPKNKKIGLAVFLGIVLYILAVYLRELLTFDDGSGYLPYNSFFLN
ncbi:EpsG family protein [Niabella sp. 22666]|uniref:EpsG family protein n=1 Tax=Niabella sp. 22666 TaxID=3453954 RepID=UPI003F86CC40